ncbi:gem-associated protein 5-like [Trematomus bernacchii]|uniref:gem-associated protein 5-like n=1 Tax=Trematomus bernacchii TaxID=40690 RepID=UPI00146E73E1|nr:gem-associated protein 5-like [Trematomus bernacchii]XP_033996258.1 gem-associated protein 5-like [Trematomus bernacchii]
MESVSPETRTFDDLDLGAYGLLSERHATCQASQRSVREIQERIAALVLRHSRAQVGQLDSGEKEAADRPLQLSSSREGSADAEQRPEEQETLLSLSTKMSEHQKQLADLPNTIKMYPHPDVVECCLVLLHISKSSSLSESLQQKAKDLLRKYGTNPSVLKTAQKFLT